MRTAWMREKEPSEDIIRGEILRQLFCGGPGHTICPTDVGRAIADPWREHMDLIRDVANHMAIDGLIEIVQRGEVVDGEVFSGPVRLRLPLAPQE
jgi:Protein of unknown function (DUF3253)